MMEMYFLGTTCLLDELKMSETIFFFDYGLNVKIWVS